MSHECGMCILAGSLSGLSAFKDCWELPSPKEGPVTCDQGQQHIHVLSCKLAGLSVGMQ